MIAGITGYGGRIVYDASRPEGTPRKLLDVSRMAAIGWTARTSLEEGIRKALQWYQRRR